MFDRFDQPLLMFDRFDQPPLPLLPLVDQPPLRARSSRLAPCWISCCSTLTKASVQGCCIAALETQTTGGEVVGVLQLLLLLLLLRWVVVAKVSSVLLMLLLLLLLTPLLMLLLLLTESVEILLLLVLLLLWSNPLLHPSTNSPSPNSRLRAPACPVSLFLSVNFTQ
jgi:hypothetical protein